jgi:hypothetical protein
VQLQESLLIKTTRMRRHVPQLLLPRLSPSPRFFTQLPSSRPQLPFLSQPRRQRWLTTERKQWIRQEVWKAGKYTTILWTFTVLGLVTAFGVQQEYLERKFPSPPQWSWVSRKNYRSARWNEDHDGPVDWARTGEGYRALLKRLETYW